MTVYEAAKMVVSEKQYKLIRQKKNAAIYEIDCKDHEGNKRGWTFLDGTTANVIVKVVEALSPENREKLLKMSPMQVINLSWKLIS